MKYIVIVLAAALLCAGGFYYLNQRSSMSVDLTEDEQKDTMVEDTMSTTTDEMMEEDKTKTVLGQSVEGRDIIAYHFGEGDTELLFVGGIHGGYEWNTTLVANNLIDHLKAHPETVPANVRVTVVPVLNPDGLFKTVGTTERFAKADVPTPESKTEPGRFNANVVDLNRNFDCDWKATGKWQDKTVSGGSEAFSEPESKAMRDYIAAHTPSAVVVWYSAAGGVFASNCHGGVLPETQKLTTLFSQASGYKAYQEFNFYEISGDMVNWLAKQGIPAISVLLTTHDVVEWEMNRKGIEAVLDHYAE